MRAWKAAGSGHTEIVQMLLRAGADVNITGGGSTALMWAAQKGHAEVVRMLLEAGANVNRKDKDVKLALVHAREKGHSDIVDLLIKAGAEY
ncbi:MAG: ankyrin repeat domain-containing protein [Methylococcaceae bacterium]